MIELKFILEAILFASQKPLQAGELREILTATAEQAEQAEEESPKAFKKVKAAEIETALEELQREHATAARSYRLVCIAGSWQFVSQPEFAPWLRVLAGERARPAKLSAPAIETLTIIAYRQPITRAEIEQIRGVSIDGVMQTLVERGLVEAVGRAEVAGRPMQYGTTRMFLEYFGLRQLEDLPAADELRRIPVERPPSLLTVDPGLATAGPEQLTLQPQPQPGDPAASAAETPASPAPVADSAAGPSGDTTPAS